MLRNTFQQRIPVKFLLKGGGNFLHPQKEFANLDKINQVIVKVKRKKMSIFHLNV